MINAFGSPPAAATRYEDMIAREILAAVKLERKNQLSHKGYLGRSNAERHKMADEVAQKVLDFIIKVGPRVTRMQIVNGITSETEGAIRYATERLSREGKIVAERLSRSSRVIGFTVKEEDQ